MKLRVKLLYFITFTIFIMAIAALSVLSFMKPGKNRGKILDLSTAAIFKDWNKEQLPTVKERHTSLLADDPASATARANYDELSNRIFKTADKIIISVLPPGSVFVPENTLKLHSGNCAEVSGTAAVPGSSQRAEQHFFCKVKVYFLPDGSCEAAFPEFRSKPIN
jgi:hypothetical protein